MLFTITHLTEKWFSFCMFKVQKRFIMRSKMQHNYAFISYYHLNMPLIWLSLNMHPRVEISIVNTHNGSYMQNKKWIIVHPASITDNLFLVALFCFLFPIFYWYNDLCLVLFSMTVIKRKIAVPSVIWIV